MSRPTKIGLIGTATGLGEHARGCGLVTIGRALDGVPEASRIDHFRGFFETMEHPRIVLLDLEPGPAIDAAIDEAYPFLEPGDVVIDPTPSWWCDTLRRFRRMRHRAIYYVDAAILAPGRGATALAGGDAKGVEIATSVLAALVGETGRVIAAGGAATAHFAGALAQGIALLRHQALDEAQQLLEAVPNSANTAAVLAAIAAAGDAPADGRAAWLLDDGIRLEAATPLLAHAVMQARALALEAHEDLPHATRVGAFVHPDDIL